MTLDRGQGNGTPRMAATLAAMLLGLGFSAHALAAPGPDAVQLRTPRQADAQAARERARSALSIPWLGASGRLDPKIPLSTSNTSEWTTAVSRVKSNTDRRDSLFDRQKDSNPGVWRFQIGVWVPYSATVRGQDLTGAAGFGTTLDQHGNIIGFGYYDGAPSPSPSSIQVPSPLDSRPIQK